MRARRVAITGLGLVTPLGIGVEPFWDGLMERTSAIRPARGIEVDDLPNEYFGQLPGIDFDDYLDPQASALWGRASRLAVMGSILAARDAKIDQFPAARTGVLLGTGYGGIHELEDMYAVWGARGWKRLKPATVPVIMANAPATHISIHFGARGLNATISTACSSGGIAAGIAAHQIRAGGLDACIAGGVDCFLNASICGAWAALRVQARRRDATACRPFSADRDGLVLSEGCAIVILEEWEGARARGARIYAELKGVGATADAVNVVRPDTTGEIEAIRMALRDAELSAADIDYVSAHATGTMANDANETRVLKECFGERAYKIPVSSIKGNIGHTMGAAGAIELAVTALALHRQRIPPTLHFKAGDLDCDLDYVADGPRNAVLRHAITNSFGFGGQNSVLALSATPSP